MKAKTKKHVSPGMIVIYAILIFWALTTIYPIFWIIINSFKAKNEILANSFSLPLGDLFTTSNYKTAFERLNIFSAYRNSIIISCTVALVVVLLAGLASFAIVRYSFRLKKFVYSLIIAGMMFPVFSTIIPVFRMLNTLHIANTNNLWLSLLSVALPQIAGNLSFAIVVLSGYIKSLPIELEEAAYMEGCNAYQIFFKVVMPLTKPSFATVAIFSFLWSYNDLFTQMFLLRLPEQRAITRLLNELTAMEGTNYGLMAAAVALVVIPVIIVYIILQKHIIKGMTAGAIKG
ncbi:carbohydrate ABC transporter permease [Faecalicatena sp. AGMB00832]|uniref:Carbohydrate ABC transporter permease n=1 Tax=Faecalicatena faecalis TaxID=2726362 RepID=A0ABS6D8T1_9FIRM|nr:MULTISPECIES: carbohydrate ABC transporter permease [Faecalicatena]MBU3877874.1 carbohydrate ABC transporter permease [Faecalicatena faecalis]MCI6465442.1 carbohydrate ABC transporter permease [Faecalicatena sp.]MDY5617274.1 carbohydrate ABC transporter permease [Lachnospiraceae bacterium]